MQIELWDPESESGERFHAQTDEQGNYVFADVPPGEYLLAIAVSLKDKDDSPCQEFEKEVFGSEVRTYVINGVRYMAVLLPGGNVLSVQTAAETSVSVGEVAHRDIDLYCHDE
jgi:hypothetical protein